MNSVLVFGGRSALDSEQFRWQLLRVPEVSLVLKEAQKYVDQYCENPRDLGAFLLSDNSYFLSSTLWRDFSSQVIQVGLFKRYQKNAPQPRFVIGGTSIISALNVCFTEKTIEMMVQDFSQMLQERSEKEQTENFLVGQSMENLKAYEATSLGLNVLAENKNRTDLLYDICKDHIIDQVISIGSHKLIAQDRQEETSDLAVMESVSMDPMLSWLWPYLQSA